MKENKKIVLLVALALFLLLSACTRQASVGPVNTPTADVPFPISTQGQNLSQFGTQTAIASTPVDQPTPQVNVVTSTPVAGTNDSQAGGGQDTVQPTATSAVPAPTQVSVPVPAVTRPTTYTLQKGEWPICIARRYDLDISSFFAANGLSMASKPAAGTVLKIPTSGSWSTSTYGARAWHQHPTTYTVAAGDTINTIACYFGDLAPEQILAVNNLKAEDIKSGVKLTIP